MEEQWDIMEFRTLLYNIKQGEISIQEPIQIHNKTRDIISNISFRIAPFKELFFYIIN